jgi:hypothetical protein
VVRLAALAPPMVIMMMSGDRPMGAVMLMLNSTHGIPL